MLIAQISDLHVHTEGDYAYGVVNTLPMVAKAIEHINQLDPRPDVVVATGDLTHHGAITEYEVLRQLLESLQIPLYLLPGNHDERTALRETFKDLPWLQATGQYLHYVVDDYPVRLIMLDTLRDHEDGGIIDEPRLAWLSQQLAIAPNSPTFLLLHHPPFDTGIPTMDCIGLEGRSKLAELVSQYPAIKRIAAGHLHRPIFTQWAGTVASTAPSLVHQVALNMHPENPGEFVMEPPAYQLHWWNDTAQALVSHTVYVDDYSGPYLFSG